MYWSSCDVTAGWHSHMCKCPGTASWHNTSERGDVGDWNKCIKAASHAYDELIADPGAIQTSVVVHCEVIHPCITCLLLHAA